MGLAATNTKPQHVNSNCHYGLVKGNFDITTWRGGEAPSLLPYVCVWNQTASTWNGTGCAMHYLIGSRTTVGQHCHTQLEFQSHRAAWHLELELDTPHII